MNTNCSYRLFDSCSCAVTCRSETAHIQIIVDRAPLRPFPKRDIALCGLVAAIVGMLAMYGLGNRLDENIHQQDLIAQESNYHG